MVEHVADKQYWALYFEDRVAEGEIELGSPIVQFASATEAQDKRTYRPLMQRAFTNMKRSCPVRWSPAPLVCSPVKELRMDSSLAWTPLSHAPLPSDEKMVPLVIGYNRNTINWSPVRARRAVAVRARSRFPIKYATQEAFARDPVESAGDWLLAR